MPIAAYLHRFDPFALGPWWGSYGIRWYGLSYLAGFLIGFLVIRAMGRRGLSTLKPEFAGDFIMAAAIGTIVGGRLGYCVFYQPYLLTDFTGELPFWGVLAINKGGMASHGGMIGIILSCIWFGRKQNVSPLHLMDLLGIVAPIGIFFGRLANFVNGELFGRPCRETLAWAVKFPQEILEWTAATPALQSPEFQKVSALAREANASAGYSPAPNEVGEVIAAVQYDDGVAAALEPLLAPRHPSQLYEALLEGLVVFVVLLWIWRKPRKPGMITAWFFMVYGVMRIVGEQFRMPDAHIGLEWLGMTRGQWLSVGLLIFAGWGLKTWGARKVAPLGGWSTAKKPAEKEAVAE